VDMAVEWSGVEKSSGLERSVEMNALCRRINNMQYLEVSKLLLSVGTSLSGPCVYRSLT
jgi:hypothetical protein